MAQRTVEVSGQYSYGTGCLIAPGLVLTARHVIEPGGDGAVNVRVSTGPFVDATVAWVGEGLDAVLLKADRDVVGGGMPVVRFGELVCDYPDRRPRCSLTGFPRASRRRAAGRYVDDVKTVNGYISPHAGSRSLMYDFEVVGSLPNDATNWQGLSGAGVFCGGVLVGLVRLVACGWDRTLLALPISHLLEAEGFAQTVAEHGGMLPRLQPADLRPLLSGAPDPVLSSSHLLDPRSQIVEHQGMTSLTARIDRWCRSAATIDVAAVTGLGGTGKSRLVAEVLSGLTANNGTQRPWSGGFLAESPGHTEYAMLGAARYPLLVAVDLAEARMAQIRDVVAALAQRHEGERVRILLLARGGGDWWRRLRRYLLTQHVGPANEVFSVAVDDVWDGRATENLYATAKVAFAQQIRMLLDLGHGDDTWSRPVVAEVPGRFWPGVASSSGQPVIYHHIAALADVLAHANPDFALRDHPMEVLLANEENYLRRLAEAHLPQGQVDAKLIRTLVAAQSLAGAQTVDEGAAAIRAGVAAHLHHYGIADPLGASQVQAFDDILAAAYPASDSGHWGAPAGPLAQALLEEVETDSGHDFVEQFLQHQGLQHNQRRQALRTIARAAQEQPDLAASAQRAIAAAPQQLLPLAAQTVATELDADQAQQWLAGVNAAVIEQARQPGADPATYRWATDFLAQIPQRPATDLDDQQRFEDLANAVLAEESPTATARSSGDARDSATRRVRVKPAVGWDARALFTFMAICHLTLITGTSWSALSAEALRPLGWGLWLIVPSNLLLHLALAGSYGSRQVDYTMVSTWISPVFAVVMSTVIAVAGPPIPPPIPGWALWPFIFSTGLFCLTVAWRIWFGKIEEPGCHGTDGA
ncbi:S1 family peptidase [Actinacidiphila glaucinigra]|uniref:S1 family peptidase n=1 Tax=Actinacidiphila glaucinigra TaxID=235986 RepID=UPI0035D62425